MKVIFTCGGTGGHINPAIAVAELIRARRPESEILFVGADDGMERDLVPRAGFRLETLKISNFQRSLTPKATAHNLRTAVRIAGALRRAGGLIDEFRPDVIVGTGGYASFPALKMGIRRGVPTAVHESNAVPGLATRMVESGVDRVMVCFEECRAQYTHPERVVVTGTPVREEFVFRQRADARAKLGIADDRPLIVSYWGSLGAREMNKKIERFMERVAADGRFRHIHATGSFGWRWMPEYVKEHGLDLTRHPEIEMREYIYDMPLCMAAADLVICRAGASTISEVAAAATPCVMVPSPNAAENHQEKNARILEARGAAEVLRESECDGDRLYETVCSLLDDPARLEEMTRALRALAVVDAAERIYQTITELVK